MEVWRMVNRQRTTDEATPTTDNRQRTTDLPCGVMLLTMTTESCADIKAALTTDNGQRTTDCHPG